MAMKSSIFKKCLYMTEIVLNNERCCAFLFKQQSASCFFGQYIRKNVNAYQQKQHHQIRRILSDQHLKAQKYSLTVLVTLQKIANS